MINVSELEFTYSKSKKKAIKAIDFQIQKGEIFGFLGPSGAGKTTTQRIIIGLLRGYNGKVEIMGKERKDWNKDFFEHIGVAFDFPNLYLKLTAEENLKLINSYYKKQCTDNELESWLDKVGLLIDKNKKVEGFSKGMKMRLNFIRSIIHDPEIYFFDEPTSGLDPVNGKIIKDIILDLKNKGKTIFLTTHNMNVAEQLCDKVAFIVDGKVPVINSPKELMIKYGTQTVCVDYYKNNVEESKEFTLKNIKNNKGFMDIINNEEIRRIHTQEATLEDIFIKLTGRELQ
ncbi:fluoroquinolone transport system ATP-binding protein [Natranaerovirga hydrolytica]|uniref:Fluoroquinolone transport system ATP-binding protein n=1 Tax=Natranaerovirga hydrolytica TaxID=680378 RepID=A0A4R1N161_9FIRM|nr:ABC transporter ATP-binding protein [Natranaerovirga hydrolytica]TCK98680.1 fluoroquinolone transport system ATP-binding protein [Natranaerovirga hydrolytica]